MHDDTTPPYLSCWWSWKGWRLAWAADWCGSDFDGVRDESGEWRRICGRLAVLVWKRRTPRRGRVSGQMRRRS